MVEGKVNISESVIDRAHRIGPRCLEASSNNIIIAKA